MQRFVVAIVLVIGFGGIMSRLLFEGRQFIALFRWRLIICILTAATVLAFTYFRWARRRLIPIYILEYSTVMFASGYFLIQVQDHRNLGVAVLIALPLWTIVMPASLRMRIFTVACSLLAIPGMWLEVGFNPILGISIGLFLAFMGTISVFLGHGIFYRLNRENYFNDRELETKRQKVEYLADHDQLTDLLDRRAFEEELEDELERAERYDKTLSLLMMDLDHFKKINDTYGHNSGDEVLRTFGQVVDNQTRQSDVGGRLGGEEFAVCLPETFKEQAVELAERIREQLAEHTFEADGETFTVTCSIGIAEWSPEYDSLEELLDRADEAMYEAKEQGRNRVITE